MHGAIISPSPKKARKKAAARKPVAPRVAPKEGLESGEDAVEIVMSVKLQRWLACDVGAHVQVPYPAVILDHSGFAQTVELQAGLGSLVAIGVARVMQGVYNVWSCVVVVDCALLCLIVPYYCVIMVVVDHSRWPGVRSVCATGGVGMCVMCAGSICYTLYTRHVAGRTCPCWPATTEHADVADHCTVQHVEAALPTRTLLEYGRGAVTLAAARQGGADIQSGRIKSLIVVVLDVFDNIAYEALLNLFVHCIYTTYSIAPAFGDL